jgi:RNA polymerase sigma-54 factor
MRMEGDGAMRARLIQQQETKLTLTKELTQAIELLQYSTLELQSFLHEQALENPFIELKEKPVFMRRSRINDQLGSIENVSVFKKTLAEHLFSQLVGMELSLEERRVLNYLIASLDENGYLHANCQEVADRLHVSMMTVERALTLLQSLEPAGVGAENLQQCLYLQLIRLRERNELAETIITYYFDSFIQKEWKAIAKQLDVDLHKIQQVWDLIRTLHPKPGSMYSDDEMNYITPDVIVTRDENSWSVVMNDDFVPELIWNEAYEKKINRCCDEQTIKYVKEKYHQFQWIRRCLEQRKEMIKQVMLQLIERQRDYFEKGPLYIKPLTMREVAETLNVHESTISRTVRNKYVQTPYGLVEMRQFFTSGVATCFEEDASQTKVKAIIQQLIAEENALKPLSDQKIAQLLNEQYNVQIARRTVAKYREQLNIPPAAKRKRYA